MVVARSVDKQTLADVGLLPFITKSDHGINFDGATSRHETGRESDRRQSNRDESEYERVGGADAVEQRGHQASEGESGEEADGDTDKASVMAWPTTRRRMSLGRAPTAMRMPIS